eukprot:TRINITY_DN287_c0_g1_i17.p1 TRINITY_DN287_c0_g1~~TRINITY_DN287_c0_g1_i17.p1  ORF type:complete len:176 (-),score=5.06 TRINITY_DN287_c0_g1_i17:444-971(-)
MLVTCAQNSADFIQNPSADIVDHSLTQISAGKCEKRLFSAHQTMEQFGMIFGGITLGGGKVQRDFLQWSTPLHRRLLKARLKGDKLHIINVRGHFPAVNVPLSQHVDHEDFKSEACSINDIGTAPDQQSDGAPRPTAAAATNTAIRRQGAVRCCPPTCHLAIPTSCLASAAASAV